MRRLQSPPPLTPPSAGASPIFSAEAGCAAGIGLLVVDTGLDNRLAQRFYFRYGRLPSGLQFTKPSVRPR